MTTINDGVLRVQMISKSPWSDKSKRTKSVSSSSQDFPEFHGGKRRRTSMARISGSQTDRTCGDTDMLQRCSIGHQSSHERDRQHTPGCMERDKGTPTSRRRPEESTTNGNEFRHPEIAHELLATQIEL